jgi:hypothetical protein
VQRGGLAAAAALFLRAFTWDATIDGMVAPGGRGYGRVRRRRKIRLPVGVEAGATIGEQQSVRTGRGAHAVLRLADGSLVSASERSCS